VFCKGIYEKMFGGAFYLAGSGSASVDSVPRSVLEDVQAYYTILEMHIETMYNRHRDELIRGDYERLTQDVMNLHNPFDISIEDSLKNLLKSIRTVSGVEYGLCASAPISVSVFEFFQIFMRFMCDVYPKILNHPVLKYFDQYMDSTMRKLNGKCMINLVIIDVLNTLKNQNNDDESTRKLLESTCLLVHLFLSMKPRVEDFDPSLRYSEIVLKQKILLAKLNGGDFDRTIFSYIRTFMSRIIDFIKDNQIVVNPNGKHLQLDVYNRLLRKRADSLNDLFEYLMETWHNTFEGQPWNSLYKYYSEMKADPSYGVSVNVVASDANNFSVFTLIEPLEEA